MKQDTGLSYFCGVSLFCGAALIDDFQLLPNNRGLQDTIHFKDEGHRCSILKGWVTPFTYFFRNILRDFLELPQLGNHIQLMEIPISSICWLSDYVLIHLLVIQLHLMAPMDFWQNFTLFLGCWIECSKKKCFEFVHGVSSEHSYWQYKQNGRQLGLILHFHWSAARFCDFLNIVSCL